MVLKDFTAENNNIKISSNSMTKAMIYNIRRLENFLTHSKPAVKDEVKNIVELYKARQIQNITTAENMILKLRTIEPSTKNKILKQYEKLVSKYENKEPLNVRVQRAKAITQAKRSC